ncbi:glutamic-type intramembrane protease PrsW [Cytobacillus sp. FSL W7-1323]|uniref:Protease PrsW n=1 Tax=Cytobacillus kochii TaxID=859143 RepID=A0A248TM54_9BACI|nr:MULTISPECIES: glutamic-type intramembrane protease PrsW [Cytobacillus]ASV69170.1 PrsW family intramembrane metalloprotease [Cytobacillus kochii]MCA1027082.1 intramembrane metalloprotease PrsW [Cytobacillus kochii]MCM3320751.1 glutamic-type intramembrane protease PrsW [Cytobacillus kochii]MCM3344415.1 glutamic-type intramembrane protease PrsW [Cytobacillus kochii]MDM5208259.1 glutamic-type intramembrane protease PrsW [Cytobacillus kochii]
MLGLISAAIAPGLALLSYFYLKDQYETEPFSMVFRTFLFGALLVFPIMFIQYVFEVEQVFTSHFVSAFLSSSMLEEFFKWFILLIIIYPHVHFDEPYDGIVYGAAVSLGFATLENIFYLLTLGIEHALGRALFPVSSHALFGVIMGYYLGKGKFSKKSRGKWLCLSLATPFLLHGTYDYILLTLENWLLFIVPFMIFLWWMGLKKAKQARILSAKYNQSLEDTRTNYG